MFGDEMREALDKHPAKPLADVVRAVLKAADARAKLYKAVSARWADRAYEAESLARKQDALIRRADALIRKQGLIIEILRTFNQLVSE